jgi:hypothetical protein
MTTPQPWPQIRYSIADDARARQRSGGGGKGGDNEDFDRLHERRALSDLGYVDGKTIQLEHRFLAERADRFRLMARELVENRVDVIIAVNGIGVKDAGITHYSDHCCYRG